MPYDKTSYRLLICIVSVCLVVLNIVRVCKVPLTYDEAWTYNDFVSKGYANIFHFDPLVANNHPVNSLLTRLFVSVFGPQVFVLRLASVLAQLVFIWFNWLIVLKLFKNFAWAVAAFLLLNLNPFLFDFWGLSRGYGLSVAFMMASVYYLLRYIEGNKQLQLHLALVFAILSVYSNFSLLNFYLAATAIIGLYHLWMFKRDFRDGLKSLFIIGGYTLVLYWLVWEPMMRLKKAGELYFGSEEGIVRGSIYSLLRESLFICDDQHGRILTIAYIIAASIITTGAYWIVRWWKNRTSLLAAKGLVMWLLLVIPLLSITLQHCLLGNLYLIERTALFLYPLFILQLVYCLYALYVRHNWPTDIIALVLVILFSMNFFKNVNVGYARTWPFNRYDAIVLERMAASKTKQQLKIRVNWHFIETISYYIEAQYKTAFYPLESRWSEPLPGDAYDFYYVIPDDKDIVSEGYAVDTSFENGRYVLYKKID